MLIYKIMAEASFDCSLYHGEYSASLFSSFFVRKGLFNISFAELYSGIFNNICPIRV